MVKRADRRRGLCCRNVLHTRTDMDLRVGNVPHTWTETDLCVGKHAAHADGRGLPCRKTLHRERRHDTQTSTSIMSLTLGCPLHANSSPCFPNSPRLLFSNHLATWSAQSYKYHQQYVKHLQHPPLFIEISTHSFITFTSSLSSFSFLLTLPHLLLMKTRPKNKSKHPAAPIMTLGQLAVAGIPQPPK